MNTSQTFKWLIIGSGAGGIVACHELAERYGDEVILLEAGDPSSEKQKDSGLSLLKNYKGAGLNIAFGRPLLKIGEANCLGGGPEINSKIYHPFPSDLCQQWETNFEQEGLTGEAFKASQTWVEEAGSVGPVALESELAIKLSSSIKEHGLEASLPRVFDSNFSKRLLINSKLKGLKIETGHEVVQIEKSGDIWKVHAHSPSGLRTFRTQKVVLASGVFETLRLLRRITTPLLTRVYYHPQFRVLGTFPNYPKAHKDIIRLQFNNASANFGFSADSVRALCAFASGSPETLRHILQEEKKTYAFYVSPRIPFHINILDGKWRWVSFNHEQRQRTISSLRELTDLLKIEGASRFLIPGQGVNWNEFPTIISKLSLTTVHLMGGLGSGERRNLSCDSYGRIKKQKGLYIADATLLNGPLYHNPQGSIMSIAKRNLEHWIRDTDNLSSR